MNQADLKQLHMDLLSLQLPSRKSIPTGKARPEAPGCSATAPPLLPDAKSSLQIARNADRMKSQFFTIPSYLCV